MNPSSLLEDRAHGHEEQALEEHVVERVGHSAIDGQVGANAHPDQHEADLVDHAITEHTTHVVLDHRVEDREGRHGAPDQDQRVLAGEHHHKAVDGALRREGAKPNGARGRGLWIAVHKPGVHQREACLGTEPQEDEPRAGSAEPDLLDRDGTRGTRVPGDARQELNDLNGTLDSISDGAGLVGPSVDATKAITFMGLKSDLQDKMLENAAMLDDYSRATRGRDDTGKSEGPLTSLIDQGNKFFNRDLNNSDRQEKHDIEKTLGTKGRQQTIDALTTRQATFEKMSNKLDLLTPEFTQPITGKNLKDMSDTLSALDLAFLETAASSAQKDLAIEQFKGDFKAPNVFMDNKDLKASQAYKNTETNVSTQRASFDVNFPISMSGLDVSVNSQRTTVVNHADLELDGVYDNLSVRVNDNMSEAAINLMAGQLLPKIGLELTNEIVDSITATQEQVDLSAVGGINIIVNMKNDNHNYTRVTTQAASSVGAGIEVPGAGINGSISSQKTTNISETMSSTSFDYAQNLFNSFSDRKDDINARFQELGKEQETAFVNLFKSLGDPGSVASKELATQKETIMNSPKSDAALNAKVDDALVELQEYSEELTSNPESGLSGLPKALEALQVVFAAYGETGRSDAGEGRQKFIPDGSLFKPGVSDVVGGIKLPTIKLPTMPELPRFPDRPRIQPGSEDF